MDCSCKGNKSKSAEYPSPSLDEIYVPFLRERDYKQPKSYYTYALIKIEHYFMKLQNNILGIRFPTEIELF